MTDTPDPADSRPFVGRDAELDRLMACWRHAKDGHTQLALLLGDSGLGKTRLVQELYTRLSEEADPNGYWPPFLPSDKNALVVAPTITSANTEAPLPWLWWGLRCDDPTGRNAIQGEALLTGFEQLDFHLFALTRAKLRDANNLTLFKSLGGIMLDLATTAATGGALPVGPGAAIAIWDAVVARASETPAGQGRPWGRRTGLRRAAPDYARRPGSGLPPRRVQRAR